MMQNFHPFREKHMRLLTDGKKHKPEIKKWLEILHSEACDFDPFYIRTNKEYDITKTQLYQIIEKAILRDKKDEHMIFFLPYPISVIDGENTILQNCTDYLKALYLTL